MTTLDQVVDASKTFISNPFGDGTAHARAQARLAAARTDVNAILEQLVANAKTSEAKRVVVAFMTLAHTDAERRGVRPVDAIADAAFRAIGLTRDNVASIAAAAVRCWTQLNRFVGKSNAASATREIAWSATFGKSLYDAWKQRADIRKHSVLIRGETGTGKEILARAIQLGAFADSPEAEPPIADINAAAISKDLIESELFGHVKGAYTHAIADRRGLFEVASGGTLFLDEIGDMALEHQPRLLRVLEERRVARVGSNEPRAVDVRVVAATSRPLEKLIKEDRFRVDLYHRIAGSEITIAPLRERREDVGEIARSVVEGLEAVQSQPDDRNTAKLLEQLRDYPWPGNARELVQIVRSHVLAMPKPGAGSSRDDAPLDADEFIGKVRRCELSMKQLKKGYAQLALKLEADNRERASKRIQVYRGTLANLLRDGEEGDASH